MGARDKIPPPVVTPPIGDSLPPVAVHPPAPQMLSVQPLYALGASTRDELIAAMAAPIVPSIGPLAARDLAAAAARLCSDTMLTTTRTQVLRMLRLAIVHLDGQTP